MEEIVKFISISDDFFDLCRFDGQLLFNDNRRPYLLVFRLKYLGQRRYFAIPFRSNIPGNSPKNQYFPLPPRSSTNPGNRHGLHYLKMFPVDKKFMEKFYTDRDPFLNVVKKILAKNTRTIIDATQAYLDDYSAGNRPKFCTDIDSIIKAIESIK